MIASLHSIFLSPCLRHSTQPTFDSPAIHLRRPITDLWRHRTSLHSILSSMSETKSKFGWSGLRRKQKMYFRPVIFPPPPSAVSTTRLDCPSVRRQNSCCLHLESDFLLTVMVRYDTAKRRNAIIFVFLTVVIDFFGLMITVPISTNLTREIIGEPRWYRWWHFGLIGGMLCTHIITVPFVHNRCSNRSDCIDPNGGFFGPGNTTCSYVYLTPPPKYTVSCLHRCSEPSFLQGKVISATTPDSMSTRTWALSVTCTRVENFYLPS
jgi:hypothetical protein